MIALPIAILSVIFIPSTFHTDDAPTIRQPTILQKLNSLDLGGISLLSGMYSDSNLVWAWLTCFAVSVILFIFGLTEGSAGSWTSVKVLLPLILSIFLMVAFFVWERLIPTHIAAM